MFRPLLPVKGADLESFQKVIWERRRPDLLNHCTLSVVTVEGRLGGKNCILLLKHSELTLSSHGWWVSIMFSQGQDLSRVLGLL